MGVSRTDTPELDDAGARAPGGAGAGAESASADASGDAVGHAEESGGLHAPSLEPHEDEAGDDAPGKDRRRRGLPRMRVKGAVRRVSRATGDKLDEATERFTPYASRRSIRFFAACIVALVAGAAAMVAATAVHTDAQEERRAAQDEREDLLASYSPRQQELELGEGSLEAYIDQAGRVRGHEERYLELLDEMLVLSATMRSTLLDNDQREYDSAVREANRLLDRLGARLDDADGDLVTLAEARTELARALRQEDEVPIDGQPFAPLEEDLRFAGFARSLR